MQIIDLVEPVALVPVLEWPPELMPHGLPVLDPADPYQVRLDATVDPAALRRLVEATRSECGEAEPGETRTALDGGYALMSGGRVLAAPQCCGDLGDLFGWREAVEDTSQGWKEQSIGHPCLLRRRAGDAVLLQAYVEPGLSPVQPLDDVPVWRIPARALGEALVGALRVRAALVPTLGAALRGRPLRQPLPETVAWLLGIYRPVDLDAEAALAVLD